MTPQTLADGRFKLLDTLEETGTTRVYRAFDNRLRVDRMVKVLTVPPDSAHLLGDLNEVSRRVKRIIHPNVVVVHEVGRDQEGLYIVTPWLRRGTVEQHLLQNGPLPLAQAGEVVVSVLRALEAAHSKGVVHEGVGAESVWVDDKQGLVLADFGIAKVTGQPPAPAPEQVAVGGAVEPASDIYAVGAMLANLLGSSGEHEGLPFDIVDFIEKCMRRRPTDRYESATAARMAFEEIRLPELPDDALPLGSDAEEGDTQPVGPSSPFGSSFINMEEEDWDVDPDAKTVLDGQRQLEKEMERQMEEPTQPRASAVDALSDELDDLLDDVDDLITYETASVTPEPAPRAPAPPRPQDDDRDDFGDVDGGDSTVIRPNNSKANIAAAAPPPKKKAKTKVPAPGRKKRPGSRPFFLTLQGCIPLLGLFVLLLSMIGAAWYFSMYGVPELPAFARQYMP